MTALAQARVSTTPAELHGSLTGYLCAGWGGRASELLAALDLEGEGDAIDAVHALVDAAARDLARRLRAREPVEPLLPEAPLTARANALVDWCRGLLGGLGLTGVLAEAMATPGVRELLDDFGHVAAAHVECADDDVAALDDLLAFVREGVARLHAELAPAGRQ